MLILFTIFNEGGIVLWERSFDASSYSIINNFIHDIFIKEQSSKTIYIKDDIAVKWTVSNEYELIFAVVYLNFIQSDYIDELLESIKKLFCQLYNEKLRKKCFNPKDFDFHFDVKIKEFKTLDIKKSISFMPINDSITHGFPCSQYSKSEERVYTNGTSKIDLKSDLETQCSQISHSLETATFLKKDKSKKNVNRRLKKNNGKLTCSSNEESIKKNKKLMRRWDEDSVLDNDNKEHDLDYSIESEKPSVSVQNDITYLVQENWNSKNDKNRFLIREFDDDIQSSNANEEYKKEFHTGMFSIFTSLVKKRILSSNDLAPILEKMNELLLRRNVTKEVADNLCESVQNSLVGKSIGSFQSIQSIVKATMESSLKKILTPSTSIDFFSEINHCKAQKRPYTILFVGVNGVGKSTSLSKIAFWFLRNHLKIVIAACDTFRSGAIEQLQVHVRNLQQLSEKEKCGKIELFENGYGKDACLIASNAILYAKKNEFDIVLVDTSGRRHNDLRLMSPLEKLINTNNIDRVFQVAEALAGADAVAQARSFNNVLGYKKKLDGFIISKVDTVGNIVGTIVSITWATGIPILFIGNGQTYTDIRILSVSWVVKMLMS